jgi:hypothetical protein
MAFTRTPNIHTAYFIFGRFNPVTIGHGAMFEKLAEDAHTNKADAYVFVSSNKVQNGKNPLTVEQKMYFINKVYGERFKGRIQFINSGPNACNCNTALHAARKLRENGYTDLVMYVGSDHEKGEEEDFSWVIASNSKNLNKKQLKGTPLIIRSNVMPRRTASNNNDMNPVSMSASKIRKISRNNELAYSKKLDLVSEGTGLERKDAIELIKQISVYSNDTPKSRPKSTAQKSRLKRSISRSPKKSPKQSRSRSPKKSPKKGIIRSRGGYQTRKSKK